jgi:hypothetical protein
LLIRHNAISVDPNLDIYLSPTGAGLGFAHVMMFVAISALAVAAAAVFICRRRCTRGPPGSAKNTPPRPPAVPFGGGLSGITSFDSGRGGGRAQVGTTVPSRAIAGPRGIPRTDTAQEPKPCDALLALAEIRMPIVAPQFELASSPLLGDSRMTPGSGAYTRTRSNDGAAALKPTPQTFTPQTFTPQTFTPQTFTPQTFTPQMLTPLMAGGDAAPERSAADGTVERLPARLAEAQRAHRM